MPEDQVDLGPVKFKLPKWCVALLSLLVVTWGGGWLWLNVFHAIIHPDHVLVDKATLTDMGESQRHFFEEPAATWAFDDGAGEARHYDSDNCTAVLWHHRAISPDTGVQVPIEVVHFVLHPSRTFDPADQSLRRVSGAGLPSAGGCNGDCWDPHPGRFSEADEPVNGCESKIWRLFEDGCEHYQWLDKCLRRWGATVWVCCRH